MIVIVIRNMIIMIISEVYDDGVYDKKHAMIYRDYGVGFEKCKLKTKAEGFKPDTFRGADVP